MPQFTVVQPLQHDGKALKVGEVIDLSQEDSLKLLSMGVIETPQDDVSAKTATEPVIKSVKTDPVKPAI